MKRLPRELIINTIILYVVSQFLAGLLVKGGLESYAIGGAFLTLGELVIKPILKVVTFPINLLTLGIFSSFINLIVFYIVTLLYPKIVIHAFTFPGLSIHGFHTPSFYCPLLLSYIVISATIYVTKRILFWIFS